VHLQGQLQPHIRLPYSRKQRLGGSTQQGLFAAMSSGLMAQHFCGAQAHMRRSSATARPQNAGSRVIFRTQLPAQHVVGQQRRAPRTPLSVCASSGNGTSMLPWQAAMDEVKKRKDLKSIMIIGAGPIVIGQVCTVLGSNSIDQAQLDTASVCHTLQETTKQLMFPAGLRV
jgi:hypothetical protein